MQHGQLFLHCSRRAGVLRCQPMFVWYAPAAGADASDALHFSPDDKGDQENCDKLLLCQLRQLRSGRAKQEEWDAAAPDSECISLQSALTTWNLQAPTAEIARVWISAVHQLVLKAGSKVVSEVHAALASPSRTLAPAAPDAAAPIAAARIAVARIAPASLAAAPLVAAPLAAASAAVLADAELPPRACAEPAAQQGRALPPRKRVSGHHTGTIITRADPVTLFDIQAKIGAGSFGKVFLAVDRRDLSQVAIKVIQAKRRLTANLRKEIHILKQCRSPHIVGYKGAFQKHGHVWIVMESAMRCAEEDECERSASRRPHGVPPLLCLLCVVCVCCSSSATALPAPCMM